MLLLWRHEKAPLVSPIASATCTSQWIFEQQRKKKNLWRSEHLRDVSVRTRNWDFIFPAFILFIVFYWRYSSHALCKDKWSRIHTIQCLTRMSAWGLAPFSSLLPHLNRHQTCGFKFRKQPHVTSVLKSLHIHTLVGKRFVFRGFQMSNSNLFCRFGLMELDSYCFLFVFAFF